MELSRTPSSIVVQIEISELALFEALPQHRLRGGLAAPGKGLLQVDLRLGLQPLLV